VENREEYRLLRLKKRIRLREIGVMLDCHKTTLSNYESGRYCMSEDKISKYKEYIDTYEKGE
jgi:hypothetical protein